MATPNPTQNPNNYKLVPSPRLALTGSPTKQNENTNAFKASLDLPSPLNIPEIFWAMKSGIAKNEYITITCLKYF